MRKHGIKKFVATLLAAGILVTSVFPGTAYAAEVGEDIAEDIAEDVLEQSGNETDTGEQTEEMVATVGTENKTEESESVTEAELETKEPVKAEEKQQTTEVVQEQNRESDWGNEEEKTKDKEEKEAKEKQLEKKEQKVSANPNGENLGWKSAYASETNLFERNLKDEKEFLVDSTTNKVVIYSDGYTVNGTYYGYQSSSTPTNRRSDFEVLKFYLEATGKQNIYLQTNITCTSPITVVGTKGLHGYGYYLKQNLQDQYDTFTYRDGVYLDSSIINVPAGATLKIAHVEMEGQAAENKICGVVDVNGNNKKTWSNEEAKKRNKDTKNGEVPQYAAVHDGISSKGKLYVTNVKIHHCKRGVLVSDGTATINGGCYYYNKGSGITVLNKTESGKVRLNGVNCFANSSTSNAKNGNAFGTGKYCNFVAPDEASYSGINLHVSTTICAWTPEGLGVTYYPITRKNERFGIAATQGDHGTYVFHEVRASENEKDGVCIKNKTVTITNGILSNNVENGLQIGSNAMVTINGSATSVNDNQQKGVWNAGTLTVNDGNFYHNTKEGILNTGTLTVNGGSYYSNAPSGVNSTGILTIHNGKIYDNEKEGVKNSGKLILCGGDIYGNKTYGVYNTGAFTMSGGKVRDNDSNGTAAGGTKKDGIYNIGTVNVSGGTISGNDSGLYNLSTANVTGGTIKENGNGIRNNTDPTTELSGTTTINGTNVNITGNTRGIQNTADENGVKVIKATITGNTTADLSQSGETFTMKQSYYLDDKAFVSVLYERVVGTDDEDGALTNGIEEKGVICEDSLEDLRTELLSFEHTGATTVTFKATDGVGNVTERRVRVWINKGKEIEEAYINRARVINRKYYNVGKEYADKLIEDNKKRSESEQIGVYEISVACMALRGELDRSDKGDAYIEAHKAENPALGYLTGYNRGGLMPIDKWYTDPEYRKCIEEAFDNQENETPEYSWKFTHEQVLETQEYVETYGISTSEHPDALWNYFNKYKSSFKKLK